MVPDNLEFKISEENLYKKGITCNCKSSKKVGGPRYQRPSKQENSHIVAFLGAKILCYPIPERDGAGEDVMPMKH